jgi:nucleoside-diphosphate-sugar epimerase
MASSWSARKITVVERPPVWRGDAVVNVVVTGGGGFLGARLARRLLAAGELDLAGGGMRPIDRLTLIDQVPAPADLAADYRVAAVQGDLGQLLAAGPRPRTGPGPTAEPSPLAGSDLIFHLAAAVSGECEADFDLGLRANLRATEALLAAGRALGTRPVLVFSSSLAVFGNPPDHPLPAVVDDQTLASPQSSYGTQKLIGEYLLADYTRKGFLRGRAMRLATVSVRPGRPNAAASGFLSGIIREPLAGQRAVCPVDAPTEVALASPDRAVDALLRAATAADQDWGGTSAVNMPSLAITVGDMVAALERAAGPAATALIDWVPDPAVARLVTSWPARFRTDRAARLGLAPDPDFDAVIATYLAQTSA